MRLVMRALSIASLASFFATPLLAEAPKRYEAALIRDYKGAYPTEFAVNVDRVRILMQQAQLEASARLGLLQYRAGFQYPLVVHFQDDAPPGLESSLAYVRLLQKGSQFMQDLSVNLAELARSPTNVDQVFFHEMTHAVLNDAVGGDAGMRIPPWVQEGLAQYVSGEGDSRVQKAAGALRQSQVGYLLADLDGYYSGAAYPQYYLAIKYINDKLGSTAVQTFVRLLIQGKPTQDALTEATALPYDRYKEKVREYSEEIFRSFAKSDLVD
jgi:hypothetical protein